MNLSQALKQAHKPVKIGTEGHGGFIYIGHPEDALHYLNMLPETKGAPRWEERKVIETYDSDPVVDDTLIIIIEGSEKGSYWYLGEGQERKKPKKRRYGVEEMVPYKNSEGYSDPTVFYALRNIVRRERCFV